jgi:pimeloyl-ACP methyl ester carboxylesterase
MIHPAAAEHRIEVEPAVDLHVREWGEPTPGLPTFLLVHGLASNARLWDGTAMRLAAAGRHALAVDLRGHGRSAKPDAGYDFATVTRDLTVVLDASAIADAVWVGQSWGGNVVVEAAWAHPDRVVGAVAVDGGIIELASEFATWDECAAALRPPALAGMPLARIEAAIRAANADWPDEGIAGALANFEVLPDGTVRPWLTLERHLAILRALYGHRPSARFAEIRRPVLFVLADTGEQTRTAGKRAAAEAAERALARSRTVWFSPAHHDLHAQQPDRLVATLLGALDEGFFA